MFTRFDKMFYFFLKEKDTETSKPTRITRGEILIKIEIIFQWIHYLKQLLVWSVFKTILMNSTVGASSTMV